MSSADEARVYSKQMPEQSRARRQKAHVASSDVPMAHLMPHEILEALGDAARAREHPAQ